MTLLFGISLIVLGFSTWAVFKLANKNAASLPNSNSSQDNNDEDGGWPADDFDGPDFDLPPGIYLESEGSEKEEEPLFV